MNTQTISPVPTPTQELSLLAGVNVLLEGPTGTGKTFSISTLIDTGIETFYLGLESGIESLIGAYTDRNIPVPANFHWHTLQIAMPGGFAAMAQGANQIGSMTYESITK